MMMETTTITRILLLLENTRLLLTPNTRVLDGFLCALLQHVHGLMLFIVIPRADEFRGILLSDNSERIISILVHDGLANKETSIIVKPNINRPGSSHSGVKNSVAGGFRGLLTGNFLVGGRHGNLVNFLRAELWQHWSHQ